MKTILRRTSLVLPLIAIVVLAAPYFGRAQSREASGSSRVSMPSYDEQGQLLLPGDYRQWIFVGSSLGLSYSEGVQTHEMFHETLMEPGAYHHFVDTGEFADGTQLVLILHGTAEGVLPGRRGRFANEIHGVEMAVKDFGRFEEGWAYYGFGGMQGIRTTAEAFPKGSCHDCHAEHAALDNVFAQFYPMLTEAAGVQLAVRHVGDEPDTGAPVEISEAESSAEMDLPGEVLACAGLDPVMLIEGREEMGKAEIVQDHKGWRYQFASEPNRVAFAADPDRYVPRNEVCGVMPHPPPLRATASETTTTTPAGR